MADLGDLPSLAAGISRDLSAAGIDHAVSGAVAMAAHGYVRATQDLDVLVLASSLELPGVFEIVRNHGFSGEDRDLIEALRERYVAALRSGPVSVEILVPVLPYHRRVLERAVRRTVAGVAVPFVTADDLVVLKMLWHRTKDVADVQALLAGAEDFDRSYARRMLADLLPEGDPRHGELEDLMRRFGPAAGQP